MSKFELSHAVQSNVRMGGRSAAVDDKEALLRKNQEARALRQEERTKQSKATLLQLAWRTCNARRQASLLLQTAMDPVLNSASCSSVPWSACTAVLMATRTGTSYSPAASSNGCSLDNWAIFSLLLNHLSQDLISESSDGPISDGVHKESCRSVALSLYKVACLGVRSPKADAISKSLSILNTAKWSNSVPADVKVEFSRIMGSSTSLVNESLAAIDLSPSPQRQAILAAIILRNLTTKGATEVSQQGNQSNSFVFKAFAKLLAMPSSGTLFKPFMQDSSFISLFNGTVWTNLGLLDGSAIANAINIKFISDQAGVSDWFSSITSAIGSDISQEQAEGVAASFAENKCAIVRSICSSFGFAPTNRQRSGEGWIQELNEITAQNILDSCTVWACCLKASTSTRVAIMNCLAFANSFPGGLWAAATRLRHLSSNPRRNRAWNNVIFVMCRLLSHVLLVTDDDELHNEHYPLHPEALASLAAQIKDYIEKFFWQHATAEKLPLLRKSMVDFTADVLDRHRRKPLTDSPAWLSSFPQGATNETVSGLLSDIPLSVPFMDRYNIFLSKIAALRERHFTDQETRIKVHRNTILQDGMHAFSVLPPDRIRGQVKVHFVNESGLDEAGIDLGGVFKEFLTDLVAKAFSGKEGLFTANPMGQMYPSPGSGSISRHHKDMFMFVGRMLGKAVWEGLQLDIPLAPFFVSRILGRTCTLDDLKDLDGTLHSSLTQVKRYDGDVADLCLDFTVTSHESLGSQVIELLPGGSQIEVTDENKAQYVHLVSDYKLNREIREQVDAFSKGFYEIIPKSLFSMFSCDEVQTLISGEGDGAFSMDDFKSNIRFGGGYSSIDPTIRRLFKVLDEFSAGEKKQFLKFVTSCPRPPIQGFSALRPLLTVHRVRSDRSWWSWKDEDRLPTASTCINLLKLPPYKSSRVMKEKLLLAITSGTGFELS